MSNKLPEYIKPGAVIQGKITRHSFMNGREPDQWVLLYVADVVGDEFIAEMLEDESFGKMRLRFKPDWFRERP